MSAALASRGAVGLDPLEVLFETPGLPAFELPAPLAHAYGGALGFAAPCLYANFVASLDGVTALPALAQSPHLIVAGSEHDPFVMGLLRACADAVLLGSGTLADSPATVWTGEHTYPPAASLYAQLRRRRGRPPRPTLAVLTGSGRIDPRHPGLAERALVLTSEQGAARLRDSLPASAAIVPLADQPPLDPRTAIAALRASGHELILCEGGPSLFAGLVAAGLVDELFLTRSPILAGRPPSERRLALLEGGDLLPARTLAARLLTLRRAKSHLFLRYALPRE